MNIKSNFYIFILLFIVSILSLLLFWEKDKRTEDIVIVTAVTDLINIENKKNLVYVSDSQGGFFAYDDKKKHINNHCTIFNGWIRETQDTTVNIMWCGAKGDGKSNDTKAFKYALKLSYTYRRLNKSLYLPIGTYKITEKINIPAIVKGKKNNFFTIYGEGSLDSGQTQIHFINPKIGKPTDKIDYWITSNIQALTLKNIRFKQIYPKGKNIYSYQPFGLLLAKKNRNKNKVITADTDTAIENCTFSRFYTVVENWGRGLKFVNNTVSLAYNPIVLEWDKYIEFPKGVGKDKTGFRAFNIEGNRFHSNGSYAIVNMGVNAKKIHSILISDNLLDIGRGIFKGVLIDGSINNTISIMTPHRVLELLDGSKNYQINGLTASGNNEAKRVPTHFIVLKGSHNNAQFNNINLNNCTGDAIWSTAGKLNGVAFNNITMNDIGDDNRDRLFSFAKFSHRVMINNLLYSGKRNLVHPIKAFGKEQIIKINNYFAPNSQSNLNEADGISF